MIITVHDPLAEPMIHRDFPCGFEELQEYVMEVCDGIKDHCVRDPNDPADTRWEYTYHQRLFRYEVPHAGASRPDRAHLPPTGRCALHTPGSGRYVEGWEDNGCYDPACLQSVWCRIIEQDDAAAAEHERAFPLQRRLQSGVHEYVCPGAVAGAHRRPRAASFPACRSSWAATATWPTVSTFTDRIWPSFAGGFWGRWRSGIFPQRTMRYEDVRELMEAARPAILEKARNMGRNKAKV